MRSHQGRVNVFELSPSFPASSSLDFDATLATPQPHFAFPASSASIDGMATITIRQLEEKTKTRLRVQAAHHGRSMEAEAREILRAALTAARPPKRNLAQSIPQRFASFGGIELELPRRDATRQPPRFAK